MQSFYPWRRRGRLGERGQRKRHQSRNGGGEHYSPEMAELATAGVVDISKSKLAHISIETNPCTNRTASILNSSVYAARLSFSLVISLLLNHLY